MQGIKEKIKQNQVLVIAFVIFQIFLVIFIILSTRALPANISTVPDASIPNLSTEVKNLPEDSIDIIEKLLYMAMTKNDVDSVKINDNDISIREGTLIDQYFSNVNMHYLNFIIDIPNIEQSYQIFHEYSDDNNNPYFMINMGTMILCPLEEQVIYPDFDCRDDYGHNGQAIVAANFLYYAVDINSFRVYSDPNTAPYTIIIGPTDFNASEAAKSVYIDQTKEKVASLGFPPDAFKYYAVDNSQNLDYYLEQIISENN